MTFSVPDLPPFSLFADEFAPVFAFHKMDDSFVEITSLEPTTIGRIEFYVYSTLAEARAFRDAAETRESGSVTSEILVGPWHGHGIAAIIWWNENDVIAEDRRTIEIYDRRAVYEETMRKASEGLTAHERVALLDRLTAPLRNP